MKPGVILGKLGTIHPEIGTILVICITNMEMPEGIAHILIAGPTIGMEFPDRASMEPKNVVAGPGGNDPFAITAGVAGHGKNSVVGKVGLEVLGRPDQVIAIKIHNRPAVESVLNPFRVPGHIVGMIALTRKIRPRS